MAGFDELGRTLQQASEAMESLEGELTTVTFNPGDQTSVEAAINEVHNAIDAKLGAYRGNDIVDGLIDEMKERYAAEILDRAAAARFKEEANAVSTVDPAIFRQLENAVSDLRSAEQNTFNKHIKKLSRILHSPELEPVTRKLTEGVDVDAFIKAGHDSAGSMVGSATLDWPEDHEKELGTVILVIDKMANDPNDNLDFAYSFYYTGNSITGNYQNMVRQMIVPFARDYIDLVKQQTGVEEPTLLPPRTGPAARKVFIVHGHDDGAREAVARFLERLEFEAIILHEQANKGRTIIEKIEDHGEVGFAVVLLTPDDVGGAKGQDQQPRARQNVLLELGYFIGRLTRSRVCALKRGDVEVPSDFGGVVYTPFDEGGAWKQALGKELEAVGFDIDWNVVMHA